MSTYEQIVRELAASDPYVDISRWSGNRMECAFCEECQGDDHDSECLWLRAKQVVENAPELVEVTSNGRSIFVRKGKTALSEVES